MPGSGVRVSPQLLFKWFSKSALSTEIDKAFFISWVVAPRPYHRASCSCARCPRKRLRRARSQFFAIGLNRTYTRVTIVVRKALGDRFEAKERKRFRVHSTMRAVRNKLL